MRTYSEKEVSAIIARAVERQKEADAGAAESGLTLDEIERLGRESGIDPAHLRAAASEMDTAGRTLNRQTEQTRTEVLVERWIDAPFQIEAWEDVVAVLRERHGASVGAAFGLEGGEGVKQIGSSYEWSHVNSLGVRTRVTVSPRDGRTRLRMAQLVGLSSPTVEGVGYGFFVAVLPALVALVVMTKMDLAPLVVALGTALGLFGSWAVAAPVVTALDRRWRAKKLRQLDALADDLAPLLGRKASAANGTRSEPAAAALEGGERPVLGLDALGDSLEAAPASRARVRS